METLVYLHLSVTYEATADAMEGYNPDSLKLREWFKPQNLVIPTRISLLSLAIVLGILGMAGTALAQSTLRLGDRNPQVTFIQQRLRQLRYLNRAADGIFDQATQAAVIRFQRDQGLNPDGVVGSATESALFAEFDQTRAISSQEFNSSRPNRILQRGYRGSDVIAVQRRLQELGYFNGSLTGYFGSTTQAAVIRFQQDYGIQTDGSIGADTRSALFGSTPTTSQFFQGDLLRTPPPPPPSQTFASASGRFNQFTSPQVLRLGNRGEDVRLLQQELRQKGFNPGAIDGVYGLQTQEAVRRFQEFNGLSPDGIAGRATLTALNLLQKSKNRYVVVVPIQNESTIERVRAVVGFENAVEAKSKLGRYVNAGAFPNRARAESRSYLLRGQGLDARVAYF